MEAFSEGGFELARPAKPTGTVQTCLLTNAINPPVGSMEEAQRNAIIAALNHCDFDKKAAAERLKIGRSTLYRLIHSFNITATPEVRQAQSSSLGKRGSAAQAIVWTDGGYRWAREFEVRSKEKAERTADN